MWGHEFVETHFDLPLSFWRKRRYIQSYEVIDEHRACRIDRPARCGR